MVRLASCHRRLGWQPHHDRACVVGAEGRSQVEADVELGVEGDRGQGEVSEAHCR